ncbi:hypothetical protein VNI00_005020 [Paramarasmius palmivorus]|uniref:PEBP-like protein n=1 Tax=Paramarasmius palmivorus TaxID=297713 RepID=A0AAW0DHN8_9AGAR
MSSQPSRTTPLPSTAEVLSALKESHVIPDVLQQEPSLQVRLTSSYKFMSQSLTDVMQGILEIVYPSGVNVIVNATPHRDQVQSEPTIRFHPADALSPDSSYTLIMTDPDLMQPNDPKNKQVRHWVISSLKPKVADTPTYAELQRISSSTHTTFLPSAPMPTTGAHRYVFILAKGTVSEPSLEKEKERPADFNERLQFEADTFIKQNNLEVVGVAFMRVQPTLAAGIDDVKLMAESALHTVTGKSKPRTIEGLKRKLEQDMPKWLYEESMEALDRYMDIRHGDSLEYHPGMDREKLEALQKIAKCNCHKNYPRRPSAKEKLPEDSAAVVQFRECLSYCRVPVSKDVNFADAKVQFHRDMFTGDASYQLTKGYKDEIKACLKEIEEKCGDMAKILAKWEVRDEVAQHIEGITYQADAACPLFDASKEWLD